MNTKVSYKKIIFIIILIIVCFGCSVRKQQMKQIKRSFNNVSDYKEHVNNARLSLLKEIKNFALGSDTIIIVERISQLSAYMCGLYASDGGIKDFHFECDNCSGGYGADVPRTYTLKELKISNFSIAEMQSIKTDIHSFINKMNSRSATPGTHVLVTFAIKEEKNYVFQFYYAYTGLKSNF